MTRREDCETEKNPRRFGMESGGACGVFFWAGGEEVGGFHPTRNLGCVVGTVEQVVLEKGAKAADWQKWLCRLKKNSQSLPANRAADLE